VCIVVVVEPCCSGRCGVLLGVRCCVVTFGVVVGDVPWCWLCHFVCYCSVDAGWDVLLFI
jgi:hypothetical protein